MWPLDEIRSTLRRRGELRETMPGLVGLRGDAAALYRVLETRIAALCAEETSDEWRVPAALPLGTLEQAQYFDSFPQWLTLAAHLGDDEETLRGIAGSREPALAAAAAIKPAHAALTPAVCYHVYSALAGTTLMSPVVVTAQSTCWRHECPNHAALERDWAFTMREVVCLGTERDVRAFVDRATARVTALADSLDIASSLVDATDPFFAPTARGKGLLQRIKSLKRELVLPLSETRTIAAASFNQHETFFGERFGIRTGDGMPVHTGCAAFGIERWTLAFLVRHGPDASAWPPLDTTAALAGAHS